MNEHADFTPRAKEWAAQFRCSAPRCGRMLLATLLARLDRTTCRAEEARRCTDHPDAMPLAWTRERSTCLALLEEWHQDGTLGANLLAYGRDGRKATIAHPGTTFDGLREMAHWGRHWGLLPKGAAVGS